MALPDEPKFYGKYRGFIADNNDPKGAGRVTVKVPALFGDQVLAEWAWPCLPVANTPSPITTPPPIGAPVWVEFEMGDIDKPIWSGFWGE